MGYRTEVYWSRVLPMPEKPLRVHPITERNVGLLRLFPGITSALVENILQEPLRGCVLESFGSGNAPDNRPDLMAALAEATERGVVIVNCTQCQRGGVRPQYATGKMLDERGVVSGADMTPEAALTKLAYLLSRDDMTSDEVKAAMSMSLRGELTDISVYGV
jgi:lysophospholipase